MEGIPSSSKRRRVDELDIIENNVKSCELVNKTTYFLNKSKTKSIDIGLEPEEFDVGIKLSSSQGLEIFLTESEWGIIVNTRAAIEKYFVSNSDQYKFLPVYTSYDMNLSYLSKATEMNPSTTNS